MGDRIRTRAQIDVGIRLGAMDVDMTPFPAVTAWLARCGQRPALATLSAT